MVVLLQESVLLQVLWLSVKNKLKLIKKLILFEKHLIKVKLGLLQLQESVVNL
jgi:hypothetical protein